MDVLFLAASNGDEEAYQKLFDEFCKTGNLVCNTLFKKYNFYSLSISDLEGYYSEIFVYVINTYQPNVRSLAAYSYYVLSRKLMRYINEKLLSKFGPIDSLDYDEKVLLYEVVSNPNEKSLKDEVSLNMVKYEIASPKRRETKESKLNKEIILLEYAGYNGAEIQKILNITRSKYRQHKKMIQDDKEIQNLKLELK